MERLNNIIKRFESILMGSENPLYETLIILKEFDNLDELFKPFSLDEFLDYIDKYINLEILDYTLQDFDEILDFYYQRGNYQLDKDVEEEVQEGNSIVHIITFPMDNELMINDFQFILNGKSISKEEAFVKMLQGASIDSGNIFSYKYNR